MIDRRSRGPRRVPYLALGICNSPTKCAGQDKLAFVDNESHISVPYEPWLIERLKAPAEAAAYLEAVLEEGDQAASIARKAKLTREATYKMLSKSGNPELRSRSAVLKATGLRIAVKPIEKRAA